jgi:hypothetical protein
MPVLIGKIVVFNNNVEANISGGEDGVSGWIVSKFSTLKAYLRKFGIIQDYFYYEANNSLVLMCEFLYPWTPTIPNIDREVDNLLEYFKASNYTISVDNVSDIPVYETSPNWRQEGALLMFPNHIVMPFPRTCIPLMGLKTRLCVPLPELQLPFDLLDEFLGWFVDYQTIDRTYTNYHGLMERRALYEISNPLSDLTYKGREIADMIKESIGMSVYYYLTHSIFADTTQNHYCPLCKKNLFSTFNRGFYFCDDCKFAL